MPWFLMKDGPNVGGSWLTKQTLVVDDESYIFIWVIENLQLLIE